MSETPKPATPTAAAVTIREAIPTDHEALRACMDQVYREAGGQRVQDFDVAFWEWQYVKGERGSVVIVAEDASGLCGYFHCVLLTVLRDGKPCVVAAVQDVGTLASHRGLGIFRSMGGGALQSLRGRGVDFIYTFPNKKSLPSFIRNHSYTVVARVPVYVRPLDVGRLLADRLPGGPLARGLGAILGGALRLVTRPPSRLAAGESLVSLDRFPEALAGFPTATGAPGSIGLARGPAVMDWRFRQRPVGGYESWGVQREGKLVAYCVMREAELLGTQVSLVMDTGCLPGEEAALARLLGTRMEAGRVAGLALGVCMLLGPHQEVLKRAGFFRVPERFNPRPFNLVVKDLAAEQRADLFDAARWRITLADWDVY